MQTLDAQKIGQQRPPSSSSSAGSFMSRAICSKHIYHNVLAKYSHNSQEEVTFT